MDFYQVWVHDSEGFGDSLVECLERTWPMEDRNPGARCEVAPLEALSTEQFGVLNGDPWLYGMSW